MLSHKHSFFVLGFLELEELYLVFHYLIIVWKIAPSGFIKMENANCVRLKMDIHIIMQQKIAHIMLINHILMKIKFIIIVLILN